MGTAIGAAAYWVGSAISSLIPAGASSGVVAFGSAAAYAGYAAVYVGLTAAVSYGVSELTKPDSGGIGASQGRELQLQVDPTFPRQMCLGRRLVAGSMVAHYSCGNNRERLHLVVPLVDHPVQQCARVFGDGRLVYNTPLVHGVRTEIPWDDRIGGLVYMTFWDGRPGQTYDSNLVSESAIEPDVVAGRKPGWTTAHVGAGIAWVHIELGYNTNVMTSMPSFLFDIVGAGLYDRRLDSTAGGSGAHRINDPSTWLEEWSDNPATALDHFLLGIKVEDDDLAFGVGLRADDVPYAAMAAAADLSDEDMVTGEGAGEATIKRYRANGVVSASDTFEDVIEALQLQMGARLVDYGGRIGIVPAEERTPVCSLSDGDWVTDDSVSYTDRRTFDDLVGAVEGRFADPSNVYQPTPYEAQLAPEASFADGGEAATRTLELPFEVHPRRAARLARIWLERERRQARLSGTFTFAAWELEPGDWFSYSSTHEQLEDELFEVLDIVKNADFSVTLTAQAVDAGIVAFDNDNDPDLSEPVYLEPVSLWLDTPEFEVEATTLTASGTVEPALLFTLTSDDPLAREIVIERAQWNAGTSEFTGASIFSVHHTDEATTVLRTGILPSTAYKVRCKSRAGARESDWAEWSGAVTTGSTYTVPRAGTADAATSGSALATALAGLGSTDAALDAAIAGLDTRADALETAAAAADSRLDAVESDLAAAVSDLDADIAAADARLDAAESDLALQGTAIGALETVTDGQATQISGLQALTRVGQNLMPEPSGRGTGAAASAIGWAATGGDAGSGLQQANYAPFGGAAYLEGFDDYSSGDFRIHYYDFAIGEAGSYALSWEGAYVGFTGSPFGRIEALNVDRSTTLAAGADAYFSAAGRKVSTVSAPSGSAWLRIIIAIPPQTVAAYCNLAFWQIKLESGAAATLFSDEGQAVAARASITTVASTVTEQGSAIATLDSRLDAAETDIDGVTGDVSTLTAANLISRMAAVDGGSASAQTLAAVKAELEGDIAGEASARTAAVSSEASARVSGDNAAADRLDDLEATVDTPTTGLAARVTTAESAISDLDATKAEASTVTSLSATVTSQGSALTAAQGDIDALQSDLDATEATIVTHTADITENASAIADAESAIATLDSRLDAAEGDVDGLTSTASNLSSRMAAIDGGTASAQTLAQVKTELEGDIAGEATARSAAVSSEASARISGDNAAASRLDDLEATIDTPSTGLAARVTSAESAITDLDSSKAEASALSSLSATVTSQGSSLAAAEGDIDDLETAAASTASTLSTHTADIATAASVNATQDSALASLDSRLDAAETDIDGVQSTASNLSSRMSAVDGGSASATSIADLVAKTSVGVNLLPYPSGLGNNTAASGVGWLSGGGAAGSGLSQLNFAPYGGPILYEEWGSYSSAGFRVYYYDVPAAQGTYTLSAMGWPGGGLTAYIQIVGLNAAKDTGTGSSGSAYLTGSGRVSVTGSPGSGTAFVRVQVVIPPQTVGSYVNLAFAQLKLEPGSVATVYSVDALAVQAHARVTDVEAAVTTLDSAQAAFESSATASLGDLDASVSAQGSAITTLQGAAAYWETVVSASGGDLAAVRLRAGAGGSFLELVSTVLRLANVSNGAVIEIMRATGGEAFFSRPISSDGGGKRLTVGPGYGVSGQEVILWFGPDTIAPAAQSRSNGYLAFGTDGKLYDASKMVATISDTSVSTSQPQGTNRATGSLTVTVSGGTAPYTYKWRSLSVGGFDLTAETPTAASTFWRGDVVEGNVLFEEWECVVTDANNSFAILRCDVELFDGDWEG